MMNDPKQQVDYKDTLNLPKTEFPMKAALAQSEPKRLQFWQELDIYHRMLRQRQGEKKFVVADGPPYANGEIHIGHALNKILKDIIVKSKHLSGFLAPYIPGWDCHGLPIEHKVEKKIGKPGQKVDAKAFRKHCREYAQSQIELQRSSFMRLGVLGDWNNYYSTMNYRFEANIIRTLGRVIARGHLHREDRPVHWCIDCGSALAEAELEYKDKQSFSIDVGFSVIDEAKFAALFNGGAQLGEKAQANQGEGSIKVAIWTTTPWTLPANQAVAVHPKLTYVLIQLDKQRIVVAKELLHSFIERLDGHAHTILGECIGSQLDGLQLQHPLLDRQVPIILGEHVTTEAGTGCVHTAPAHGYDDYVVAKKYGIVSNKNPVAANGCFLPEIPQVGGIHINKANDIIIELLADNKSLLTRGHITHSYPHCWRHKTPLIFRATPQWFISMDNHDLRAQALQAIKEVTWVPSWGQARIEGMVQGRPDWCISRQRAWGTPIPLFIHKVTGEIHPQTLSLIEQVAAKVELAGVEAWYDLAPEELLNAADTKDYIKSEDTLDVWFDSGAYHICVGEERSELADPVDMYLEGSDQHRGWFQVSLLSSVAIKQRAPYKTVLTHGFTIDMERRKMSKSLGNALAPEQVMNTLGADILRLWVAATDYRGDLNVSEEILKRTSDAYRRIRNTARFLLANLAEFDPASHLVPTQQMLKLDRWLVAHTADLQREILAAYNSYQFHVIYQKIHNFCVDELGSFYLDIIKDRQYTGKTAGIPRRSAQTAMYYVAEALVRWIAPILSFTAEEIWQYLPPQSLVTINTTKITKVNTKADTTYISRPESVFLTEWFTNIPELDPGEVLDNSFWQQVLQVRSAVNKKLEELRVAEVIGSGLEAEVDLYCAQELYQLLAKLGVELRFVLITSQAKIYPLAAAPADSAATGATAISGLVVIAHKSAQPKCVRCWHRVSDVDSDPKYPQICRRCVENITIGEQRVYA